MRNLSSKKGVTLLEIIIVIAMISFMMVGVFTIFSSFIANTYVDDTTQAVF